jgi:hypothetical protein
MPKVRIKDDEAWPVFSVTDVPIGTPVEVPEKQLRYWDVVEREYQRVQEQMATAVCAAHGHRNSGSHWDHCLVCHAPAVVTP